MIDRRIFFRQMGYGTAGLMVLPNLISSCTLNCNGNQENSTGIEGIMPIAAIIDCSKILMASQALNGEFTNLITGDINRQIPGNLSRIGSCIPFEDDLMLNYFEHLKKAWDPASDVDQKKASLLLGWLIFHPLQKAMSEVYGKLIDQGYHYDAITTYYDTFLFKQISGQQGTVQLSESSAQNLFNTLATRMITRVHTMKPDYQDGPGWVVRMSDWRISNKEKMNQYGSLFIEDDQEKFNHFIKRYNVYNPEDRLIQLVRNEKSSLNSESVDKLILSDPGNSIYTKSLVRGYKNVVAAEQFFQGKFSLGELKQLL